MDNLTAQERHIMLAKKRQGIVDATNQAITEGSQEITKILRNIETTIKLLDERAHISGIKIDWLFDEPENIYTFISAEIQHSYSRQVM